MKKISYYCDLCKLESKQEGMIGFKFGSTAGKDRLYRAYFNETDHHLCVRCAKQLREFLKDLTELG